jgi:hypothetical protein
VFEDTRNQNPFGMIGLAGFQQAVPPPRAKARAGVFGPSNEENVGTALLPRAEARGGLWTEERRPRYEGGATREEAAFGRAEASGASRVSGV